MSKLNITTQPSRERPRPFRQARGEKRIDQLLKAAGEVFAQTGYDNATTNAIAARAGVSPGTLYQFFPNKQAMAEALASEYAVRCKAAQDRALHPAAAHLPLEELINRIVNPLLAFHYEAPGFEALIAGSVISAELANRTQRLDKQVRCRLEQIFLTRRPKLPRASVREHAHVCVHIFKAFLPSALAQNPSQRRRGVRALKTVLARYLEPVLGKVRGVGRSDFEGLV